MTSQYVFLVSLVFSISVLLLQPIKTSAWLSSVLKKESSPQHESYLARKERREDIQRQLKSVTCPARESLELKDYWECLWRTSLTSEGIEQHKSFLIEDYVKQIEDEHNQSVRKFKMDERKREKRSLRSNPKRKLRRVKRQFNSPDFDIRKVARLLMDLDIGLQQEPNVRECQNTKIYPGISLSKFIECILEKSPSMEAQEATYRPVPYPEISEDYDKRELTILTDTETTLSWGVDFAFKFQRLTYEELLSNFAGADAYLDEQLSQFRYKYDNLNIDQRQPGWSYSGSSGPPKWHLLDVKKLFIPVVSGVNVEKIEKLSDFAQAYPGLGEIAQDPSLRNIEAPLDYRWSKDSGYHAYTRYLLPLLDKNDIDYYQYKNYIPEDSVEIKDDSIVIEEIIKGLEQYLHNSSRDTGSYVIQDDIPFVHVYREFLSHYFHMDTNKYEQETPGNDLKAEFNYVRVLFRDYVEVALAQERCVRKMLNKYEYRRDVEDTIEIYEEALKQCVVTVHSTPQPPASGNYPRNEPYNITNVTLRTLYDRYFDRKEARQRYSLPVYPIKFPICKHSEPSPINIVSNKGRKSSLRSYIFGDSAYKFNKFFISYPNDGSNLLTIGIVDGERMDDSSVRLTGGAVKGQNLTFQMMHIRVADNWKAIGSEHYIDGVGAQMELQMVFTISGTADELEYWHILARVQNRLFQFREKLVIVLSVLVDVLDMEADVIEKSKENNQDPFVFEPLTQAVYFLRKQRETHPNLEEPRGYVSVDPIFRFIDFIPNIQSKFYTYRGSLSWPPCFGYVLWSVYEKRLYMSKRQFDEFAKIPAIGMSDNNKASSNNRRFGDIYVQEEDDPNISYEERQAMIRRRTVDRFILEGNHNPVISDRTGVVPDDFYFIVDTPSGADGIFQIGLIYIRCSFSALVGCMIPILLRTLNLII